jgi:hypothetical protein
LQKPFLHSTKDVFLSLDLVHLFPSMSLVSFKEAAALSCRSSPCHL